MNQNIKAHIEDISGLLRYFREAEQKAKRLAKTVPNAKFFVAVCGVELEFDTFWLIDGYLSIRKVTNPPGTVHVCRAADLNKTDYFGVSRFSSAVRAELTSGGSECNRKDHSLLDITWDLAALLKLRGHRTMFCPAFATASWDTVSAVSDNSIVFSLLDDVPLQIGSRHAPKVSISDAEWAKASLKATFELREKRRFGLAMNIMYTWNQTFEPRMAVVTLWCALEALFGDKTDRPVTRRLVDRICSWLPSLSVTEVEESYNLRCDACHGRWLEPKEMAEAIDKADMILRQAIIRCVDTRTVPLPDWS